MKKKITIISIKHVIQNASLKHVRNAMMLKSTIIAPSYGDAADGTKTHTKQANQSCLFLKIYQEPHCDLELICLMGNIIMPEKL